MSEPSVSKVAIVVVMRAVERVEQHLAPLAGHGINKIRRVPGCDPQSERNARRWLPR